MEYAMLCYKPALTNLCRLAPFTIIVTLTGCAWGTAVQNHGAQDTYRVSQTYAPIRGGVPQARSVAQEMAHSKCTETGGVFYPLEETTTPWPPTYEVIFTCVDANPDM
jgi:hypothetical protein